MSSTATVPWRYSPRGTALRLFLTCWLIYTLHFATNTVREIYLALAIGDHFSFRVDDYARIHPDLFEKPGYGWHIGANPGGSMMAAIPYALARPVIEFIVEKVNASRRASGQTEPPAYNTPWPMAREFYKEAWKRGLDIKFGLAAFVMQAGCMAPVSALAVAAMYYLMRRVFGSDRTACWLAILYAFGTPVFFRTGYLNHNLILGHLVFIGFVCMSQGSPWRYFAGGLAGGAALLFDYSGVILLGSLFLYGFLRDRRNTLFYGLGGIGPVLLLWLYQYQSFGHPFYPGQHWMPPVEWIDRGYQGFGPPQLELLGLLAFDYRYGLFVTCPLFLLALLAPWMNRGRLSTLELAFLLGSAAGLWLFFGGVNYTRLQFNTGIRYLAPVFPLLFVPAAIVLMRLPKRLLYFVSLLSITEAWCLAMHRDVERGLGVLDPILHIFLGGFKLPALTVLSRMGGQLSEHLSSGVSPLPLFILTAAIIYGIWKRPGAVA
ncbi:MAG: hypothetical protein HY235_17885 [Acidobacteria bacterium]|nr:hypothetical protein [Acidobacteriota bacterium]